MKAGSLSAWIILLFAAAASAQVDFPTNPTVGPKKFNTRPIGGGVDPGASVESSNGGGNVRYVTYVVLADSRLWTNASGKPLEAKLIAFEDLVVEAPKGTAEPKMPVPPANPTVIKEGKVRLLVNRKPVEVLLTSLSSPDQEFIETIRASLAKKAAAGGL